MLSEDKIARLLTEKDSKSTHTQKKSVQKSIKAKGVDCSFKNIYKKKKSIYVLKLSRNWRLF